MTLPDFNNLGYLPGGDHEADLDEVEERFGRGRRRQEIMAGLRFVVDRLQAHGVTEIWLDGSFVTDRLRPSDVDVVYRIKPGGDRSDWADVGRSRQDYIKQVHRVDLWRHPSPQQRKNVGGAGASTLLVPLKDWWGTDREDRPKGLVKLKLTELDPA